MGDIYAKAQEVIIWLGGPDEEVEQTMRSVRDICREHGRLDNSAIFHGNTITKGLRKMLAMPWWSRMWVIQEVVLSSQDPWVGCGHTWVPWEIVAKSLLEFSSKILDDQQYAVRGPDAAWSADPFLINRFILLRDQWNTPSVLNDRMPGLREILFRTRGHQASDARDQIYALYGLIKDQDERSRLPAIDYNKSVSQVYQETMVAIIKASKNLDFLVHAPEDRNMQLPSWCADFSKQSWDSQDTSDISPNKDGDEATELFEINHDPINETIEVPVVVLGEVSLAEPFDSQWMGMDPAAFPPEMLDRSLPEPEPQRFKSSEFLHSMQRLSLAAYMAFANNHGREEALKKLVAGEVWEMVCNSMPLRFFSRIAAARRGIVPEDNDDIPDSYAELERFVYDMLPTWGDVLEEIKLIAYEPGPPLQKSSEIYRKSLLFSLMLAIQTTAGRYWFVAAEMKHVGRAEKEVKPQDLLCLFPGCQLPAIVRPSQQGTYRLVSMAHCCEISSFKEREKASSEGVKTTIKLQ